MAIQPLAQYAGANELATGVPQFGDILQQAIQNHYQNQLTKAQTGESQQKALQNQLLNQYLSGAQGGSGGLGSGNDLASAMLKYKLFGTTELPQEKSARELQDYENKERLGKNIEQELGTTSFTTQQQATQSAINNALPGLKKLINYDEPNQNPLNIFSPSAQAEYEAMVAGLTDSLVAALGLPKSNESLALAEKMLKRGGRESSKSYHNRLKDLFSDLKRRASNSTTPSSYSDSDEYADKMSQEILGNQNNDPLGIR